MIPDLELLEDGENSPIGYQNIRLHMIFDTKIDITQKDPLFSGGHMNETPDSMTYYSVVECESVSIALLLEALDYLDVLACDIGNAYLNTPCR